MNKLKPHQHHKVPTKAATHKTAKRSIKTQVPYKKQHRTFSTESNKDSTGQVDPEQIKAILSIKPVIDFEAHGLTKLTEEQKELIQKQSDANVELGAQMYMEIRKQPEWKEAFTAHTEKPLPFLFRYLTNEGKSRGTKPPTWKDTINIHYQVSLADGTVLDDSGIQDENASPLRVNLQNPAISKLGAVVAGFGLLSVGDVIQLVLPHLSQGDQFHPQHPNAPLLWTILRVEDDNENVAADINTVRAAGAKYYDEMKATGEYTEHEAGFLWKNLTPAVGGPKPSPSATCLVHYQGLTTSGEIFDSSYKRGEPTPFPLGSVVKGFRVAISECMSAGDKIRVILPPELAYGNQTVSPQIPGGSTLTFDIELIKF